MKIIVYYLLLLVFIALLSGFLIQRSQTAMSMGQMLSVSVLLALYVVAISFVGEGKTADEREMQHRYLANRSALVAGTIILSVGVLVQVFTHRVDYWLLGGLLVINLTKIISLVFLNYKN